MKCRKFLTGIVFPVFLVNADYLLPDTLWVNVTLYDFHGDGTNPNFEACNCGRKPGMIQDTLSIDRKPLLKADLCCNDRINEWFRPSGAPGSSFAFDPSTDFWTWSDLVPYQGRAGELVGPQFDSAYDMASIVMYDSLPFLLYDSITGTYEFVRNMRLNDKVQFFWLDGKGFGEEPAGKGHNYSYTMELHHEFTYHGGEFFRFFGDDDAWIFINSRLVLDLGGMQSESGGTVDLDNLAAELDLVIGRKYMFDFFYTERRTPQSNIVISTNILTPSKPNRLVILPDTVSSVPGDSLEGLTDTTIQAGECVNLFAYVVDDTGALRSDWSPNIIWEVYDSLGNPLTIINRSESNLFCLTEAYGCVSVVLSYQDSLFPGIILHDTVNICVEPGPPDHLVIEASPDTLVSLRNDNPLDMLTLSGTDTVGSVYAILRDRFGNFAGYASASQWSSLDPAVARAMSGVAAYGEGLVLRDTSEGATRVIAVSGNLRDTIDVLLENITYTALRIVSGTTTLRDVDTLRIRTDQDTTLIALGLRSDNGQWDNVLVRWSAVGITLQPGAPSGDYRWVDVSPVIADTGIITISRSGGTGTVADTAVVIASNGLPNTLVLYPSQGAPGGGNTPLPPPSISISVTAGQWFSATAKVFDGRGNWLQSLESSGAPISWRIVESAGNPPTGVLNTSTGATATFYPQRAYNTVYLVAEYRGASLPLADTVMLTVRPGAAHHLVIEGSPERSNSPNRDDPLQSLLFTASDSSLNVYAVIRDSLGNFISCSQRTLWTSFDTLIASVISGNPVLGEGIVRRETALGETFVTARNGDDTTLVDTLRVILSEISYEAIRIVVNHNGLRDIESLAMRSGEDTLLFALALRSDTREWIAVRVAWSSTGLISSIQAPALADKWDFSPTAPGEGLIIISKGALADTVRAQVADATPVRLVLYPEAGAPSPTNTPYVAPPLADTVTAGSAVPLVAKLFSADNRWLQSYENNSISIQWTMRTSSGTQPAGSLQNATGAFNSFNPTRAYTTVSIIAAYSYNVQLIADTVRLYILPAGVHHLVIESSSEWSSSPNSDNPIDTVLFGYADTVQYVYAVLRDIFGNFVAFANDASWTSADTSVAAASAGIVALGQGRLIKRIPVGITSVSASDKAGRSDSTIVRLTSVRYDSLRILSSDGQPITQLVMGTTGDTTLFVQGKRNDNGVWEYVRADWFTAGSIAADPGPPSRSEMWAFSPVDTGTGAITAALGQGTGRISVSIAVQFIAGVPMTLVLYPKAGAPGFNNEPYPDAGIPVVVQAGSFVTIVAKLFDENNIWFSSYERHDQPFTWEVIEQPGFSGSGTLSDTVGFATIYSPVRAYRTVLIAATFTVGSRLLSDTMAITIVPGPAHHLVIEANQNRQVSPNADNPLESITLTSKEAFRRVYAVIRDELGNWVDYSLITEWISGDSLIAAARSGITSIGEGVIERRDTGSVWITAKNRESRYGAIVLIDSVQVFVKSFWYLRLRILTSTAVEIDTLAMSTNDDTTLIVQGMRNDSAWENVQAQWEISPTLEDNIAPPQFSDSWEISPKTPATGWIRVTLGVDSITLPDTVLVIFTQGEPLSIRLELLTPPELRIAGDTIVGVVRIYNRDGPVPGDYCFYRDSATGGALYYDPLDNDDRPDPELFINWEQSILPDRSDATYLRDQCFSNGMDTVRFVLYYAPYDKDSLHQIFVVLGGMKASSVPFNLLPAALDSLAIKTFDKLSGDTITLQYPQGGIILTSIGFDCFGNQRGPEPSIWSTDGTLHPIERGTKVTSVYYESSKVLEPEEGFIIAAPVDSLSGIPSGRIYVIITGPIIRLLTAMTGDTDGNGYLDRITLNFSRPVALPDTIPGLLIIYGNVEFSVVRMAAKNDSDSVWTLVLREDAASGDPQTSWVPFLFFDAMEGMAAVEEFVVEDGAGPVIWSIVKTVEDPDNRTRDLVRVQFSEPVADRMGNSISVMTPPESLFVVWTSDEKGTFTRVDYALAGINNLQLVEDDAVEFYMLNRFDLTSRHFMNINAGAQTVADTAGTGNFPHPENRRVRVQVKSQESREVVIIPNPSQPTYARIKAGTFLANHEPRAREWVIHDRAGSIISFKITTPEEGTVRTTVNIHDMAGNPIAHATNPDIAANLPRGQPAYPIDIYWNGFSSAGMKVSPGVYRVVVYVDYSSGKYQDFPSVGLIGIAR